MNQPSIFEILQFAINMEEEGAVFYTKHGQDAKGEAREVLLKLASDEVKHAQFFKELYKELEASDDQEYLFGEEVVGYFKNYANATTFSRDVEPQKLEEAILEGIKTERATIDFYELLQSQAKDEQVKVMLVRMIEEEKRHESALKALI